MSVIAQTVAFAVPLMGVTSTDVFQDPKLGNWCILYDILERMYFAETTPSRRFYGLSTTMVSDPAIRGVKPIPVAYDERIDQARYGSVFAPLFRVLMKSGGKTDKFDTENQIRHLSLKGVYVDSASRIYETAVRDLAPGIPVVQLNQFSGYPNLRTYGRPDVNHNVLQWMGHSTGCVEFNNAVEALSKGVKQFPPLRAKTFDGLAGYFNRGGIPGVYGFGFSNLHASNRAGFTWDEVYWNIYSNVIITSACELSFSWEYLDEGPRNLGSRARIRVRFARYNDEVVLSSREAVASWSTDKAAVYDVQCFPLTYQYDIDSDKEQRLYRELLRLEPKFKKLTWNYRPLVQPLVKEAYDTAVADVGSWIENLYEISELFDLVPLETVLSAAEAAVSDVEKAKLKRLVSTDIAKRLKGLKQRIYWFKQGYNLSKGLKISLALMLADLADIVADLNFFYKFGIRPAAELPAQLKDTLHRVSTKLKQEPESTMVKARKRFVFDFIADDGVTDGTVTTALRCVVGGFARSRSDAINDLYAAGLLITPSRLWACVKWSFLIDYGARMTDRMELPEAYFLLHTLDPRDFVLSWRYQISAVPLLESVGLEPLFPEESQLEYYVREKSVNVPFTFYHPTYRHLFPPAPDWSILASFATRGLTTLVRSIIR